MFIAVIDDEENWQNVISQEVRNILGENHVVDVYATGEAFLQQKMAYQIVLMDVDLGSEMKAKKDVGTMCEEPLCEPRQNGIAVAEQYVRQHKDAQVILLSSHMEYSVYGYHIRALRYVLKRDFKKGLKEALSAALEELENDSAAIDVLIAGIGRISVQLSRIRYVETQGRKKVMHLLDDDIILAEGMDSLWERLVPYGFYRTHKSYIVNLKYVEQYDDYTIAMKGGGVAFLSTRKRTDFKRVHMVYVLDHRLPKM